MNQILKKKKFFLKLSLNFEKSIDRLFCFTVKSPMLYWLLWVGLKSTLSDLIQHRGLYNVIFRNISIFKIRKHLLIEQDYRLEFNNLIFYLL